MTIGARIYYNDNLTSSYINDSLILNIAIGSLINYIIIATKTNTLRACIEEIKVDWLYMSIGSQKLIFDCVKITRHFFYGFLSMLTISMITWEFTLILDNVLINNTTYYKLAFSAYVPFFDSNASPFCYYINMFHLICEIALSLIITPKTNVLF